MKYLTLVAGLLGLVIGTSHAGTLDISRVGMGARTLALGKAQVAAMDLPSVFINPANASLLDKFALTSMYTNLNEDVLYSMVGAGFPLMWGNYGTLGISYINAGVTGIQFTSRDSDGRTIATSSSDYSSKLATISYGKKLAKTLAAGCALKIYSKSLDAMSTGKADGLDLDLGLLFTPKEELAIGLTVQNILPVDLASLKWGTGAKEDIPICFKGGVNFVPRKGLRVLADYDLQGGLHGGVEWEARKSFYLRGGAEVVPIGKNIQTTNLSAGLGFELKGVAFDYAYYLDTVLNSASSHFFSINYTLPYKKVEVPPVYMAKTKVLTAEAKPAAVIETILPQKQLVITEKTVGAKTVVVKKIAVKKTVPVKKKSSAVKPQLRSKQRSQR